MKTPLNYLSLVSALFALNTKKLVSSLTEAIDKLW